MTHPPRTVYLDEDDWRWLRDQAGGASHAVREMIEDRRVKARGTASDRVERAWALLSSGGGLRRDRMKQEAWLTGPAGREFLRRHNVTATEMMGAWDASRGGDARGDGL